jgi:hypothetical protein
VSGGNWGLWPYLSLTSWLATSVTLHLYIHSHQVIRTDLYRGQRGLGSNTESDDNAQTIDGRCGYVGDNRTRRRRVRIQYSESDRFLRSNPRLLD